MAAASPRKRATVRVRVRVRVTGIYVPPQA